MHRVKALGVFMAAAAGFGAAVLLGPAVAKTFTLHVATASVGGQSESIVVNHRGFAVYTLSGDSKQHPKCTSTNGCWQFWPPVKVKSAQGLSKPSGVKGKLGVWRHNGFMQLTLGGHPLYTYAGDGNKHTAAGEGIMSFGGTWHVIKASGSGSSTNTGGNGATTTSGTTGTTTSNPYPYPYP